MRDKFVRLPMTVEVIRKINSLEAIQSRTFRYRDIEVGDEEPDINWLNDRNPDQVLGGLEEDEHSYSNQPTARAFRRGLC